MRTPDIDLTEREKEHYANIRFDSQRHEDIRASIMSMVALAESLMKRDAIPDVRRSYFTDPECNPGGRGKSHQQIFERNGTSGPEILAHPSFMQYLEYFICGPDLPAEVIAKFKDAARFSGYLTGSDVVDLFPFARSCVRSAQLAPHEAAEEFFKLALECGAVPSSADSLRKIVLRIR